MLTGQASKVARGLRTIGNNFSDAANDAGLIEYKVKGATKQLELFDAATNDMKSTFQILSELKDDWDKMSNAEQQALGIAYAGKNQFEVFAAVMDNFGTATKAAETALNSTGSAIQENASYAESLEFKVNTLKSTFEDFSNRVLNSELVGGFIDAGTALLKFANSDAGVAITQVALLTAGIVGVVGVIGKVVGAIGAVVSAYKTASAVVGASKFMALLTSGKLALILGAVGLAVAGVTGTIALFKNAVEKNNKPLSEFASELSETEAKIKSNEDRLKEINALPWQQRTSDILEEKTALEEENQTLRDQIDLIKEKRVEAAKKVALSASVDTGETETKSVYYDKGRTREEQVEVIKHGAQAYEYLMTALQGYVDQLGKTNKIEDEQRAQFEENTKASAKYAEAIQLLIDSGVDLEAEYGPDRAKAMRDFVAQWQDARVIFDDYGLAVEGVTFALEANTEAEKQNASARVEAKTLLEEAGAIATKTGSIKDNTEVVEDNASAYRDLVAQEIIFNKTVLDVSQKVRALKAYAIASGAAADEVNKLSVVTAVPKPNEIKKYAEEWGLTYDEAKAKLEKTFQSKSQSTLSSLWDELEKLIDKGGSATGGTSGGGTSGTSTTSSKSSASTKTSTSKVKENIHAEADAIYETIQEANAVYEYHKKQQLAALEAEKQAIQNNLDTAKATMDQYQAELDAISASQETQVAAVKAQLEEQLAIIEAQQNVLQKQMDDINDEIDSINAVIDYAQEYADRQIEALEAEKDAIQETIDVINAKYDAQLEDLDKTNDALDEQIKREKLLKALHEAQAKKKLVYQNGRFVYAQDIAAISKTQEALDEFDREKQLEEEKAAIEEARQNELEYSQNQQKALEEEIKRWQDYKKGWASLVSDYQYNQNALIAVEKYGINFEKQNWDQRLGNLNKFNDAYTDIMAEQARVQDGQTKLQEQATRLQEAAAAEQERIVERMQKQYDNMSKILDMARQTYEANQDLMDDVDQRIDDVNNGDGYDDISQSELRDLLETDWAAKALKAKTIEQLQYYLSQRQRKADYQGIVLGSSAKYPSQDDIWYRVAPGLGDYGEPWGIPGYRSSKPSSGGSSSSGGYTPPARDEPGQLYAAGTTHASGGMALVGEEGPELRVLNNGDGILPSDITRNLWGWGSMDPTSVFGKLANHVAEGLTFNNANLSFPNVRSGADARDFVTNLKNLAYQYAFAR